MSLANTLGSDRVAVVGAIDPDALTANTYETGWIDMADFPRLMAIVLTGTLGTSATVDAKFEQATDGSGTGAKDVAGKAIAQLTEAGTDQSDMQAIINLHQSELDLENSFTHARLSLTIGTATSDAGAVVLGLDARYAPASDNDAASVDEIVA